MGGWRGVGDGAWEMQAWEITTLSNDVALVQHAELKSTETRCTDAALRELIEKNSTEHAPVSGGWYTDGNGNWEMARFDCLTVGSQRDDRDGAADAVAHTTPERDAAGAAPIAPSAVEGGDPAPAAQVEPFVGEDNELCDRAAFCDLTSLLSRRCGGSISPNELTFAGQG